MNSVTISYDIGNLQNKNNMLLRKNLINQKSNIKRTSAKESIVIDIPSKVEPGEMRPSSSYNKITFTPKSSSRPISPNRNFRGYPISLSKYSKLFNKTPSNQISDYPLNKEYRNLRKMNLSSMFHGNIPDNPDFPNKANFLNKRYINSMQTRINQYSKMGTPKNLISPNMSPNLNKYRIINQLIK